LLISVKVQLGANNYFHLLVKGTHTAQTQLVLVPVNAYDGLLRNLLLVEQFYTAHHSDWQVILVLEGTILRVMVLIDV